MQGLYVNRIRPKSKAAVKRALADQPSGESVQLEATSVFGNEYDGLLSDAPDGRYTFVGPDPYTSRKFYGTITVTNGKAKVA